MYVNISEFAPVGLHRFRVDWADAGRRIFQTHAQATTITGAARMSFGVERHRSRVPPAPSPRSAPSRRVGNVGLPAQPNLHRLNVSRLMASQAIPT